MGKGRKQRQRVTLLSRAKEALLKWRGVRGEAQRELDMLLVYDDARENFAAEVAEKMLEDGW